MFSTTLIKVGMALLLILATTFLGKIAFTGTPAGVASGTYEYKVATLSSACIQQRIGAGMAGTVGTMFSQSTEDTSEVTQMLQQAAACTEEVVNGYAKDGWELHFMNEATSELFFKRSE